MQFKSVVINLEKRTDRLDQITKELNNQSIEFVRFNAIEDSVGWKGYNKSIEAIFNEYKDEHNLFIFEDDCYFESEFNRECLQELPNDYDGLWLGSNLQSDHKTRYSDSLSRLENGWNTHATLFSKAFRIWCLENWNRGLVFDEWVRINALPVRKCFVLNPMIAFQRPSQNDIINDYADYTQCWENAKARLF